MHDVIIIPYNDVLATMLGLMLTGLGYYTRGVLFSILGELVYKPTAKYIIKKGAKWERTHPNLLKWALHYLENHKGLHPHRGKCQCNSRSSVT